MAIDLAGTPERDEIRRAEGSPRIASTRTSRTVALRELNRESRLMMFVKRFDLRNPPMAQVSMADRYAAVLDMAVWAERNGGVGVVLSEHHGSDDGYRLSPRVPSGSRGLISLAFAV